MTRLLQLLAALVACALLAACGTDSGGSGSTGGSQVDAGFSLRLTDGAVEDAAKVELTFVEVKLRSVAGGWTSLPVEGGEQTIDLLELQGTKTAELRFDEFAVDSIPNGNYDELRLVLSSASMKNRITLKGGGVEDLKIPSGTASGLKVKGDFSIAGNRPTALVADVDLRQSIKRAGPNYLMNPVIRLVKNDDFGHIRGALDFGMLIAPSCSDGMPDTYNAAYVYAGHDVVPDDIDQSTDSDVDPIATTAVQFDFASGGFVYEAAFLPAGDYTIAFTCNADRENLDADDDLRFFGTRNVTVKVNDTLFL